MYLFIWGVLFFLFNITACEARKNYDKENIFKKALVKAYYNSTELMLNAQKKCIENEVIPEILSEFHPIIIASISHTYRKNQRVPILFISKINEENSFIFNVQLEQSFFNGWRILSTFSDVKVKFQTSLFNFL